MTERAVRQLSIEAEIKAFCLRVARQAFEDEPPRVLLKYAETLIEVFYRERTEAISTYEAEENFERANMFKRIGSVAFVQAAQSQLEGSVLLASASFDDSPEQAQALEDAYFWDKVIEVAEFAAKLQREKAAAAS